MSYGGLMVAHSQYCSDPQFHRLLSGWYIVDESLLRHEALEEEEGKLRLYIRKGLTHVNTCL